jgi:hypothetical protein
MSQQDAAAPQRTDRTWPAAEGEPAVSELASEWQGALSPFGAEQIFPLPPEALNYEHPTREELPNR